MSHILDIILYIFLIQDIILKILILMNLTKRLLINLSIGTSLISGPVFAEDNFGWYATGSIGASKINDLDYLNLGTNKMEFDPGLSFDLGFGYDFGSTRIEGTWIRSLSNGGLDRGIGFTTDSTIDSLHMSAFYDFRSSKKWSPFVGLTLGSTKLEHKNFSDTGFSYGLALGVSYKTSDTTEVFVKSTGIITPELKSGGWHITDGSYGNTTMGVRFLF